MGVSSSKLVSAGVFFFRRLQKQLRSAHNPPAVEAGGDGERFYRWGIF
jgi:hypothetical protein